MARLDRKLQVEWSDLKRLATKKRLGFHSLETSNATEVYLIEDGKSSFWAAIFKAEDSRYVEADRLDWESTYEAEANGPTQPRDYDGRNKVQPVTLGAGQWHYWHGEGDGENVVGGGQPFQTLRSSDGTETVEWSYRDPVWIAGGSLRFQGAQLGDSVSFLVFAPATPVTPSAGGNTGNCNLHESGVIVPAAGDGAYDVDLAAAVPVPSADSAPYSGFWDYELPADMKGPGTVSVGAPGSAKYHLIPAEYPLDQFVKGERLLGSGQSLYEPQNINVSLCLPCWKFRCSVHNEGGGHSLEVVWRVLVSRYWTAA